MLKIGCRTPTFDGVNPRSSPVEKGEGIKNPATGQKTHPDPGLPKRKKNPCVPPQKTVRKPQKKNWPKRWGLGGGGKKKKQKKIKNVGEEGEGGGKEKKSGPTPPPPPPKKKKPGKINCGIPKPKKTATPAKEPKVGSPRPAEKREGK